MEVWTLINKNDKRLIRFSHRLTGDEDFMYEFFFIDNDAFPIWFIDSEQDARISYNKYVHPKYCCRYRNPHTNDINIDEWELVKFKLDK